MDLVNVPERPPPWPHKSIVFFLSRPWVYLYHANLGVFTVRGTRIAIPGLDICREDGPGECFEAPDTSQPSNSGLYLVPSWRTALTVIGECLLCGEPGRQLQIQYLWCQHTPGCCECLNMTSIKTPYLD